MAQVEKYILIRNEEDKTVIAPVSETGKYMFSENYDFVFVKRDEWEENGKKTFDDPDEARDFYDASEFYNCDRWIPEPEKGEYICVYAYNNEGVGEDPYCWDYAYTGHKWWNGSNWMEFYGEDTEELYLIDTITKKEQSLNYGRAVHYHIFKNEIGQYIVGYENDAYADPICEEERFSTEDEARVYVKSEKVHS